MASSGSGTSVHMSGEMFKMMTGCDMLHVPFKGAGPAIIELIPGRVHVLFDNLPSSIGHIKGGKLRALAVTTLEPDAALPGVPTLASTVPGYEATAWSGMGAPKGTPRYRRQAQRRVNRAADPKMKEKPRTRWSHHPGTPEDFGRVMAERPRAGRSGGGGLAPRSSGEPAGTAGPAAAAVFLELPRRRRGNPGPGGRGAGGEPVALLDPLHARPHEGCSRTLRRSRSGRDGRAGSRRGD
jgi:hypothetical protein